MKTIAQLRNENLILLVDDQDTRELREEFPDYDSFFVEVGDGEYNQIWGFVGSVPYLSKLASRLK